VIELSLLRKCCACGGRSAAVNLAWSLVVLVQLISLSWTTACLTLQW